MTPLSILHAYQQSPSRETLDDLWRVIEPVVYESAIHEARKLGKVQDHHLIDDMVAESAERIVKLSRQLVGMHFQSESAFLSYIRKTAKGAALDASDSPLCGPTRRNCNRRQVPIEPWHERSWPTESDGTVSIPGSHGSYSYTDHTSKPLVLPQWTYSRGDDWQRLVEYVARMAQVWATGWQRTAVDQVLNGDTDEATARRIGIAKSTWQLRRRAALSELGSLIASTAGYEIDEIGRKYLGNAWIESASRAESTVLHIEGQRIAA